jgi:hypothetical protein
LERARAHELFERWVEIPRIRYGSRQTLEILINEEALLLAKFLRGERERWMPRIAEKLPRVRVNISL